MIKKLGNIVDVSQTSEYNSFFNKVGSIDEIEPSIPTLIIGMSLAKSIIPDFSMFNRKSQKTGYYWTFSKKERRKEYTDDLFEFKKNVIMSKVENVRYEYVNFPCYTLSKLINFIKYMNGSDRKICFLTKESSFVFIYTRKFGVVFGLSLSLCDYCGIDRKKVVSRLRSNKNNRFINGLGYLDSETRSIIGDNIHYILPLYDYFDPV